MAQPLAEFLVSLRLAVDATSQNTFNSAVDKAKLSVMALGAAVIGTGLKLSKMSEQWIDDTAKTGITIKALGITSVSHFKAMEQAAQRVGVSAETMLANFENISQMKFTLGAGATGLLQLLNPNISEMDDAATILEKQIQGIQDLKKQGIGSAVVAARASAAGMDPRAARIAYTQGPKWQEELKQFTGDTKGWDKGNVEAAMGAADMKSHLEALRDSTIAGSSAMSTAITTLNASYKMAYGLMKTTDANTLVAADTLREMLGLTTGQASVITNLSTGIGSAITTALGIKSDDNQDTAIGLGVSAVGTLMASKALLSAAGRSIGIGAGTAGAGVAGAGLMSTVGTVLIGAAGGYALGTALNDKFKLSDKLSSAAWDVMHPEPKTNSIIEQNNALTNQTMGRLQIQGLSKMDAADVTANWIKESGLNPFAKGDSGKAYGLGQWHPARQSDYQKLYGHTMQSVTDKEQARQEQTQFGVWELFNTEKKNWDKRDGVGSPYSRLIERPLAVEKESNERGESKNRVYQNAPNINITQHINGTSDPKATADMAVKGIKDNTNGRYNTSPVG